MNMKTGSLIALLTVLMLLMAALPVFAEEQTAGAAPERAYEVDFTVLKEGSDEASAADEYVRKPAKITVENGLGYAELTLLNSSWITAFEVEQDGELSAAAVVAEDEEANTRTVKFAVGDIRQKLNARIAVEVPGINYKGDYTVQLAFDTSGMPGAPAQPEESAAAEENAADEETAGGQVQPGEVALSVLKDGTDEPSSLGNYMSKTGQLDERDGVYYLSFTLLGSNLIPTFQYADNEAFVDAVVLSEDEEADSRTLEVAVADVNGKLTVALEVNAGPRGVMQHQAQIVIAAIDAGASEQAEAEASAVFTDIAGHWAQAAIEEAASRGIVQGLGDQTFNPNGKVSRAQLAVILTKALELEGEVEVPAFADQGEIPTYAADAIAQVQAAGLLLGYEDQTFRPNAYVSRAQLAVIVARAAGLTVAAEATADFPDAEAIPAWAKPSVAAAVEAGLLSGRSSGLFAPLEETTRAEVAALVLKVIAQP